jgi:hypothetical protein
MLELGWTPTLAALATVIVLLVVAERRARRPFDPTSTTLIPWRAVILICGLLIVLLMAHVVSLATGTPLTPRATRPF